MRLAPPRTQVNCHPAPRTEKITHCSGFSPNDFNPR
jgi:hypothetical protein